MELLFQAGVLDPGTLPMLLVVAGLLLSVAEAIAPGANFIVVGVSLLGAGLVGLAFAPLASPFALGLLVLVFGAIAFYGYHEFDVYGGKGQPQTRDSGSLTGKTGRVTERVTETDGQVKLDEGGFNPHYSARSIDGEIPAGTEVIVVDPGGGNVLTVESLAAVEDDIDRALAADRSRTGTGDAADVTDTTDSTAAVEEADESAVEEVADDADTTETERA
ncbi:NfeD family protein [Halopenitus persicus]|uniref:Membrane protein implicated in regulation of membrane protease activity n=1 Tax=Halopenitus persicus TaxID=1048396 RepID=A0A1H3IC57_9EURY|nr:NfeD family protein [Halopenitus persicus]QHS17053.1 NfeD family protein [haloarchaeon 3A1-DGR]SDY25197.1 Membrane protein implicated in regulation of membrane protease activity [Halopenitus persicus]